MFSKITVGQGTIHLSRVVAIILAFMAFGHVLLFFAVTFIFAAFVRADQWSGGEAAWLYDKSRVY